MIDEQRYEGLWWLPENESAKLSGTLTIERGRAQLEVFNSFGHEVLNSSDTEQTLSTMPFPVERILGITTNGKKVTLERCRAIDFVLSLPGIPTTTYRAEFALLGAWFVAGEEVTFDEIAMTTTDLDVWASISGFSSSFSGPEDTEDDGATLSRIDIAFEPPEAVHLPLEGGQEARVEFTMRYSGVGAINRVELSQAAALHLRYARPKPLPHAWQTVIRLRNFLCLAVGRPVALLSVKGYRDDLLQGSGSRRPIEVIWELPHNPDPPERALHPAEMLFTLPEVMPSISDALSAWLARHDVLGPVFNLYFGMLYHPAMYTDVHFLAYAQAVETYDYRRRDVTDLPAGQHEQRMEAILTGTPDQYREWLQTRLQRSNELSLRRRIRDVLDECPDVRDKIVGATPRERANFVALFVDSRNYYTHYSPDLENRAATGVALYLLVVQLRAIIEMSLLRELGFTCDAIDAILDRVQRYAEIANVRGQVPSRQD